jgi:hypothetical protein
MIKNEAEILAKASQYLSIKTKFFNEMNSFYEDKRKIAREIEIFNNDPPSGMTSNEIRSVLSNLEKLKTRRNALNIKEKDFFDELESLRQMRDNYIKLVQSMEKSDGVSQREIASFYSTRRNSFMNLEDHLILMETNLSQINTERALVAKNFKELSSVPQEFGVATTANP